MLAITLIAGSGVAIANNNIVSNSPIVEADTEVVEEAEEEPTHQIVLTLTDETGSIVEDNGDYTYSLIGNTSYLVHSDLSGNTSGYLVFASKENDLTYRSEEIKADASYEFSYIPELDETIQFSLVTDLNSIPEDAVVIENNEIIGEKAEDSIGAEEYSEDNCVEYEGFSNYGWNEQYESNDYDSSSSTHSESSLNSSEEQSTTTSDNSNAFEEEEYTDFNPDTDDPQMYFHDCLGVWTAQDYIDHGYDPPYWLETGWDFEEN